VAPAAPSTIRFATAEPGAAWLHGISFRWDNRGLRIFSIEVEEFADLHPGVEPTLEDAEQLLHDLCGTGELDRALERGDAEGLQDRWDDIASGGL
jgi:hypothetical protein